jgi:replicative DNA helicase
MSKYVDTTAIINVIGSIFLNPLLLDNEKYNFYEEDFPQEFHKIIFGSIYNLHNLGAKEITISAIEDYLEQRPKKMAIYKANKGTEYLNKLAEVTQLATFDYYYSRMKKMTLFRMYQKIGLDLSWLYDNDNILDTKKKQAQEEWLDNTSLEQIAETIDSKISAIKMKYADDYNEQSAQAGENVLELIESFKKNPEYGYPMFGPLINTITRGARLKKFYLRSAPSGVGKAIPNSTVIPTPNGYKTVGEVQVGDYLFGQDGYPTKVLQIHPQPEKKEIWKVTFSDGRVAECCKDHLWEYRYRTHRGYEYRVESTEEIYNRTLKLKNGFKDSDNKSYRFAIKINKPVNYETKYYSIHPYVMGALLGDGSFRYSNTNKALTFSSADEELPSYIADLLGNYCYKKSSEYNYNYTFKPLDNLEHNLWVEELLKDYKDLWQLKSEDKFIPNDYLLGSVEQRFALLQGLMDTDGSIDAKGRTSFTTASPKLRDNVIELCQSLGMSANYSIDKRDGKYSTGECYEIHIQCKKEVKPQLFKLKRKKQIAEQYANNGKRSEYKDHLSIINIEKTDIKVDMTCFTVDNDAHLFLMNDFIVTHNTRAMIADACNFACSELYDYKEHKWIENGSKEPTLYITTEQEINEIQTMMIAFISDVDEEHILTGEYYEGEWERVVKASNILQKSPIYIQELHDFSLQDIENTLKRGIHEHGVRYLCLDYLHTSMKILSEISSKSKVSGLREDNILFLISVRLKDLANDYGVFILSSTQLNGRKK